MKEYRMKTPYDEQSIIKLGFYYDRVRSDDKNPIYMKKFPVYKQRDSPILLEAWFRLDYNTGEITVDVVDSYNGLHGKYNPWYYYEYGDYTPILEIINEKINKEIKRCGIIDRRKHENKN